MQTNKRNEWNGMECINDLGSKKNGRISISVLNSCLTNYSARRPLQYSLVESHLEVSASVYYPIDINVSNTKKRFSIQTTTQVRCNDRGKFFTCLNLQLTLKC